MKRPPTDDVDHDVESRRLVGLLKGEGLTRSSVVDLLRPDSLTVLSAILTDRLFAESGPDSDRLVQER